MSSRALRKLQGNDLLGCEESKEDSDDEVHVVQSAKKNKKKKATDVTNVFDLLNNEDEGPKSGEEEVLQESDDNVNVHKSEEPKKSSAKKKRKKKKKKGKETPNQQAEGNEEEDEIDASIREVNRILNVADTAESVSNVETRERSSHGVDRGLLSIEHKHLNHENELKKIFGHRVIQAEQGRRRNPQQRRRQKSSWMAVPKDSWPQMGKIGLSMALKVTEDGSQYFVYEHNHQYQQIQFQFYEAVESLNPQNIGNILQLQPYHIDGLMQLSEVFRMNEDLNMATELVERALYAMELSFHPLFNMATGTSRLEYKYRENRSMHLALFKHVLSMGQRGCNRTALEYCKFLLSLDPDNDPLCAMLLIDFYAIRSEQYPFLLRLYNEWEAHRNLSQLPNFAFSVPIALLFENEEDTTKADEMLQDSLLMFPGVLRPLLEKCSVQGDASVVHEYFTAAEASQSDGLKHLIALYVGRCYPCWKIPEVMQWLERNVKHVVGLIDAGDPRIEIYKQRRLTRYKKTPRNVYRHILISEIPSASATIPQDVASAVLSYDPLPPLDSVQAYSRQSRPNRAQTEQGALSSFLRSLLPNYNPNEPAPEEGAAGGEGQQLRQGVGVLMDAMRDLLNNIRMVEHPIEHGAADGDGEIDRAPEEWD